MLAEILRASMSEDLIFDQKKLISFVRTCSS